ncbi:hypothetical protein [Streptomyces sp. NPDC005438]|uniref:hypothetical protein n=1 Tax=Streptomyces sp. NPDC005438 TaxID=3156880 RepID=UPI0033A2FE4A
MGEVRRPRLSRRAARVADEEGLGAWSESVEVNRAYDRQMSVNLGVLVLLAPWPFLVMAYQAAPWRGDDEGAGSAHVSWSAFLASGLTGLVFLGLAVMAVLWFVVRIRVGGAAMHFFEHGAVAERPRGALAVFRYDQVSPRHVVWDEPMDQGEVRGRVQLWIRMPVSGHVLCLDGMKAADRATLAVVVAKLGLPEEPEALGRLSRHAPTAF